MTKAQFLAFSLPFGLFCEVLDKGNDPKFVKLSAVYNDGSCSFFDTVESEHGFESVKPILRPISDLVCEIDGKIGLVELAKISEPDKDWTLDLSDFAIKIAYDKKNPQIWFDFQNNSFYAGFDSYGDNPVNNQFELFEYLLKKHYDVAGLIEKDEAINLNNLVRFHY